MPNDQLILYCKCAVDGETSVSSLPLHRPAFNSQPGPVLELWASQPSPWPSHHFAAVPHATCVNVPQHSMISTHMQVQERLILCDMYQHTFHSKTYILCDMYQHTFHSKTYILCDMYQHTFHSKACFCLFYF